MISCATLTGVSCLVLCYALRSAVLPHYQSCLTAQPFDRAVSPSTSAWSFATYLLHKPRIHSTVLLTRKGI